MVVNLLTRSHRSISGVISSISILLLSLNTNIVAAPNDLVQDGQGLPNGKTISLAAALDPQKIIFQQAATGLTNPVYITNAGDESGRLFVLERSGKIRIIKNGVLLATPFLNIQTSVKSTGGEQGLLALAFHPSYRMNGRFFVVYTAPRSGDTNGSNLILKRFHVSVSNPDLASSDGTVLLTVSHPTYSNHNGGTLAFGGDGYLYWSIGDGGSSGDPNNNGQNLYSRLGKILRIDVDSTSTYKIPPSNPFYTSNNVNIKKEIWAYGLRNPWRLSFDRLTHDLYIGDVGQSAREEIDFQPVTSAGGEDYGWRIMEGTLCYDPPSGCNQSGKILPITEYAHTLGCSVTGGYVYRGSNFPSLYGYYFYGDYCSGRLFSLIENAGWQSVQIADTSYNISTFGEDEQGELYLADYGTGKLYNIGYQEETIPPVVNNIVRADLDPVSTYSVNFTVTFSEAVKGVNLGDFALAITGVSAAKVSAVNGSGDTYTVTVNTGIGSGTIRLDVPESATITDLAGNALVSLPFTGGETYTINKTLLTFNSSGLEDGWILESTETSNTGGSKSNTTSIFRLGDDASNRQYRAVLSFDSSPLPDNAVITSVTLKLKYAGQYGTNPFSTHGKLLADVIQGAYKNNPALQLGDFSAVSSKNKALIFSNIKVGNWYLQAFNPTDFQYINLSGITQFRLRFSKDDNNDFGADYLKIYSGDTATDQSQLLIEYYVP